MKLKTPTIVALSVALGIVAGAGVTAAIAAQRNMQAALDHLIISSSYLDRAADNKGGHKIKAKALINAAITEVKLGIRAGAY
jgi:hypothetical protein